MKRRAVVIGVCVGLVLMAVLAVQHSTQAQRQGRPAGAPGGQPPAGQFMMQMLNLESLWAQTSFELGVADEVLINARKIYQESWNERKKLIEKMGQASGDTDAMRTLRADAEKLRSNLDNKLKDVLTTEQMQKLAEWEKAARERMGRRSGAGAPPQGMPPGGQR